MRSTSLRRVPTAPGSISGSCSRGGSRMPASVAASPRVSRRASLPKYSCAACCTPYSGQFSVRPMYTRFTYSSSSRLGDVCASSSGAIVISCAWAASPASSRWICRTISRLTEGSGSPRRWLRRANDVVSATAAKAARA